MLASIILAAALTYHHDVAPVIGGRCTSCHMQNGLAPFSLTTYEDVVTHLDAVVKATNARRMPPWPAGNACTTYRNDHSLTQEQILTIGRWAEQGAARGNPNVQGDPLPPVSGALTRVDQVLTMAEPYQPSLEPDEYRCFILPWPADAGRFITGFGGRPGNRHIVHHMIAYLVPPENVARAQQLDAGDPGQGYACFGDAKLDEATWLGGWAPGTQGVDYPAGTGLEIAAGSAIVLQVHYHIHEHPDSASEDHERDQSALLIRSDDQVERKGQMVAWLNPTWFDDPTSMFIPSGDTDAHHSFSGDLSILLAHGRPVTIHGVFHHMHELGRSGRISVERADRNECLLDIPKWDFNWQLQYWLASPVTTYAGERVRIDCHWDNSPGNQPVVNGVRLPARDVMWGDGTRDEMCLGTLFVTIE